MPKQAKTTTIAKSDRDWKNGDDLHMLVQALYAACKEDGRIALNGTEYTVYLAHRALTDLWTISTDDSLELETECDQFRTMNGDIYQVMLYYNLTITVGNLMTRWRLYPLGKSTPGQRSIEHLAGSPKPEPEILGPEEDDYND